MRTRLGQASGWKRRVVSGSALDEEYHSPCGEEDVETIRAAADAAISAEDGSGFQGRQQSLISHAALSQAFSGLIGSVNQKVEPAPTALSTPT